MNPQVSLLEGEQLLDDNLFVDLLLAQYSETIPATWLDGTPITYAGTLPLWFISKLYEYGDLLAVAIGGNLSRVVYTGTGPSFARKFIAVTGSPPLYAMVSQEKLDEWVADDDRTEVCNGCSQMRRPEQLLAGHCEACRHRRSVKLAIANHDIRRIRVLSAWGSHTEKEWSEFAQFCGSKCLRCGKPEFTKDHVQPLSRGGTDELSNLQPLCRSCNSWKFTRTIDFRDNRLKEYFKIPALDAVPG